MNCNQIIYYDINLNKFPRTKKFEVIQIEKKIVNDSNHFRIWNPSKSSLSAAVICGLEIVPINRKTPLLYIGQFNYDEFLNFLDLVENKQTIYYINENHNKLPHNQNLKQFKSINEIDTQKFDIIYIDNSEYCFESIKNITDSYLRKFGYLIIQFSKLSPNSIELFNALTKKFEVIQEVNIESFFRNKSLLILRSRN